MKAEMHLLIASALITVSISVYIPRSSSRQWSHAESYLHNPDSISSVKSSGMMQWFPAKTDPDVEAMGLWKDKVLVKRTGDEEVQDMSDERPEAGAPTPEEIKEVLSDEEFERYNEALEGKRAYHRAMYLRSRGGRYGQELSPEDIEQVENELETSLKSKMAEYRKMERLVRKRLIESGKARPATAAQVQASRETKNRNQRQHDSDNYRGAASPRHEEVKEVLSPEEFEKYMELLGGQTAYNRAYLALWRAKQTGRELIPEEVEQLEEEMKVNRPKMTEYRKMNRNVRKKLIESGKARPATVQQEQARREADRRNPKKRVRTRANNEIRRTKHRAIRARIESGQATEQDRKDWEELEARREKWNKYQRELSAKKRGRFEELGTLIENGQATEQDREEWSRFAAKRQARAERARAERDRARQAKHRSEAQKAEAPLEDVSNTSEGTTSNKIIESKKVDISNGHPLQLIGNKLSNGAGRLIENLRDRWQTIPWDSYLPRHTADTPRNGPWSTSWPISSPPLIQPIP